MDNDLKILKILKIINQFPISDKIVEIDLFCAIQKLEGYTNREIREELKKMLSPTKTEEINPIDEHIISYIENKDKFGALMRKLKGNPAAVFRKKGDFLKAFLKFAPSPQDVRLPFSDWDYEILLHYLKIMFNTSIAERAVKETLYEHTKQNSLPFLGNCRKELSDKEENVFFYDIRFLKEKKSKKFTHFVPICFRCTDFEMNTIYFRDYNIETPDDIFYIMENCLPKGTAPQDTIFLIQPSNFKRNLFRTCFLKRNSLPKARYIFSTVKDLKKLAHTSSCEYLQDFYDWFSPLDKKLRNLSKTKDTNTLKKCRTF